MYLMIAWFFVVIALVTFAKDNSKWKRCRWAGYLVCLIDFLIVLVTIKWGYHRPEAFFFPIFPGSWTVPYLPLKFVR